MFNLLKKGVKFIRVNSALLFSLILIIVIPVLIFLISSFLAKSFQEHIDLTLQKQAMMTHSLLSSYVADHYDTPRLLQKRIERLSEQNPGLAQLRVLLPVENNNFEIIASGFPEEIKEELSDTFLTQSWHKNQAIAFLTKEGGIRYWRVMRPFYDLEDGKIGLISIDLSLEDIDSLVVRELKRAYSFAIIAIIFILLLVIHHTRLFQYVNLFNKLRQVDKVKDSFMNMAIHELRSPVVNVKNYISELRRGIGSSINEEAQLDLKRVEISVKRLDSLINDILDVVRIEQGCLSFTPEIISPIEHIKEVVQELSIKAKEKGLKLNLIGEEARGKIKVNTARLKEIAYNLIENAIKYTKKGEVSVIIEEDVKKGKFYIAIKDTGIGVSAEEQKSLFEQFYRVKNRETADIEGTGLGLWTVKNLCQKMKGIILVESIKGVGSKFVLIFPLIK